MNLNAVPLGPEGINMSETSGEIFRLIPKIMQSVGAIGKDRRNQQQGYQFRGIDDVYNAMQGPLAEHGVFVVPQVTDRIREERPTRDGKGTLIYTTLTVKHTFYAPDGSSIDAVTVGEAMDSGDKSSNKAMSAAMKYALIEVFSIPTEGDNDTENHTPEVGRTVPAAKPKAAPRKPEPSPVANTPIFDNDTFLAWLDEAMQIRDFTEPDKKIAKTKMCERGHVRSLTELPADRRQALLDTVKSGMWDKFKLSAPTAA